MLYTPAVSAEAFQQLTTQEKEELVTKFADQLLVFQWDLKYRVHTKNKAAAETILRLGLLQRYLDLSLEQRSQFIPRSFSDDTALTLFALEDLLPGNTSQVFGTNSTVKFEDFKTIYNRFFVNEKSPQRSDEFIDCVWRLFVKHGNPDFWESGNSDFINGYSGSVDHLLTQTAAVLASVYSEEKILSFLERMIRESPISPLELIRLVKSDLDLANMPISWAAKLASSEAQQ